MITKRKTINCFVGKYNFLSNFYICKVEYGGIKYPSVEHGFQAAKSLSNKIRLQISKLSNPADAKRMGRTINLRLDWETYKEIIMYHLILDKFRKSGNLRKKLLATGNAKLIEGNHWGDTYWGICHGKGKNRLGVLLMKARRHYGGE